MIKRLSWLLSAALILAVILSLPAGAADGYPYGSYFGPGSDPSQYLWTDASGNAISPYTYYYRNCTDYVAWKLSSLGIAKSVVMRLGNGGEWGALATRKGLAVNNVPQVGTAAVGLPTRSNPYGHVAFVEAQYGNGTITVSEYNYGTRGGYGLRTGTPATLGLSEFVHFSGVALATAASAPVVRVWHTQKTVAPDGTQLVYSSTASHVYETWWHAGAGDVHSSSIFAQNNIVDFSKISQDNGVQSLYTAVDDGVWETWWYPGGELHHAKIISLAHVKKVVAENQPGGIHTLYVLAADGPYEYWWPDGGNIIASRLATIRDPIAMVRTADRDGTDLLYTATRGGVFESWWRPGKGVRTTQLVGISQQNIVDIAKDVAADGTEQLYTATTTSVWETKWGPAVSGITHTQLVTNLPGIIAIKKRQEGDGTQQLYVAATGVAEQYWWRPGAGGSCSLLSVSQNDVASIDESVQATSENLYTAAGPNVYETWWDGYGRHTTELASFD